MLELNVDCHVRCHKVISNQMMHIVKHVMCTVKLISCPLEIISFLYFIVSH